MKSLLQMPTDSLRLAYAFGSSKTRSILGTSPTPFSASFAVTDRCNLHCSYCDCPSLDRSHLSLENIALLFNQLKKIGVVRLGLMGGEPMVRSDLAQILLLAKERGFVVCVNSNLTLYQQFPERLSGVDLVFTSLDGTLETHEKNRGPGSYTGVLDAASMLLANGVHLVAICVVTEKNIDEAEVLLKVAKETGFQMHFQVQCSGGEVTRGGYAESLTNERIRKFFAHVLQLKRRGLPIASSSAYLRFLSGWDDFRNIYRANEDTQCAAGRGFLYIDPRGNAYPCIGCRGRTKPVNLITHDWQTEWDRTTPCTECVVGPMLEFNLLFQYPFSQFFEIWQSYRVT